MSLTKIVTKYGKEYPIDKSKWFKEASIRIPAELQPYIDLQEGKLVELAPVPESLQDMLKAFRESWDKAHDPADLSEY